MNFFLNQLIVVFLKLHMMKVITKLLKVNLLDFQEKFVLFHNELNEVLLVTRIQISRAFHKLFQVFHYNYFI